MGKLFGMENGTFLAMFQNIWLHILKIILGFQHNILMKKVQIHITHSDSIIAILVVI